jgi:hypothetical protein
LDGFDLCFQVEHVSDLIRMHGNLVKHSAQAVEHLHADNKYIRRHMGRSVTACRDAVQAHTGKLMLRWLSFLESAHSKTSDFAKIVRYYEKQHKSK